MIPVEQLKRMQPLDCLYVCPVTLLLPEWSKWYFNAGCWVKTKGYLWLSFTCQNAGIFLCNSRFSPELYCSVMHCTYPKYLSKRSRLSLCASFYEKSLRKNQFAKIWGMDFRNIEINHSWLEKQEREQQNNAMQLLGMLLTKDIQWKDCSLLHISSSQGYFWFQYIRYRETLRWMWLA